MRPLKVIYLSRIGLAVVAAALSTALTIAFGQPGINTFLNGITISLALYLITYYVFKAKYRTQVEKQSKLVTMGIGIYFFTWLVTWVLMYTIAIAIGLAPVPVAAQ